MLLTYYDYINESKGISNFIKKISNEIISEIYKNYKSFDHKISVSEMKLINNIYINIINIKSNYNSKFYVSDNNDILNNLCIEFDIPLKNNLDIHYFHEIIIHEITHLYEFYNIVQNERNFPLYNNIKKSLVKTIRQDNFDIFSYFRNLVYLSLDNELNARVAQTYQLLKSKNINNKEQLLNILKTTHIWKKFKEIENFNPKKYTSDLVEILGLDLTLILINEFNDELRKNSITFSFISNVNDKNDIIKYFNSWNKRFKYKLKKHLLKLDTIIDEVIKDNDI